MALRVTSARYHRNGCGGAGYYTLRFRLHQDGRWHELGAVLFDQPGHVAVLDDAGDSWRCEDFEDALRAFIASPEGDRMIWGDLARPAVANEA